MVSPYQCIDYLMSPAKTATGMEILPTATNVAKTTAA